MAGQRACGAGNAGRLKVGVDIVVTTDSNTVNTRYKFPLLMCQGVGILAI